MELDILGMLAAFMAKYPQLSTLLMVMGALRAVFKPIFAVLQAYVDSTPDQADNAKLAAAESSSWYKGMSFVLDWFASVKLKQ